MESVIDKVVSNKIDRYRKIMLYCGIGGLVITFVKVLANHEIKLSGLGWWFDTIIIGLLPTYMIIKYNKSLINRSGQFIDWQTDRIIFKLKEQEMPIIILTNNIINIAVGLDIIEITESNGYIAKLDISDFDDYNVRQRIKENFTKLRSNGSL